MKTFNDINLNDIVYRQKGDTGKPSVIHIRRIETLLNGDRIFYGWENNQKMFFHIWNSALKKHFVLPFFASKEALIKHKVDTLSRIKEKVRQKGGNQYQYKRSDKIKKTLKMILYV